MWLEPLPSKVRKGKENRAVLSPREAGLAAWATVHTTPGSLSSLSTGKKLGVEEKAGGGCQGGMDWEEEPGSLSDPGGGFLRLKRRCAGRPSPWP
jgi:hypothetical protein